MNTPESHNRLAKETSPYLRQHAANPVDWYPWGKEAFDKARMENKPLFLSVGYSSCHWCHVMAHESFENQEVADLLNAHFVSIKVDREEHPDIDALYMTATQLMTQRGGWPNSVWLLSDGRPWYAGTYYPREDRGNRIGFKSLLGRLDDLWKNRRTDVEDQANQLTEAIKKQQGNQQAGIEKPLTAKELVKAVQAHFRDQFDPRHGGFGDAPKFPPHSGLLLLMRTQALAPSSDMRLIVERTLNAMACGGIYDQVGGGFHRYATDDKWLLPHFEKMLYDNAQLLKAYARAAVDYQSSRFRRVAVDTAAWLRREMTHPDGGFYSALDADSDGEEGKYYTWSDSELATCLDPETLARFRRVYSILPSGNFSDEATGASTGLNIPHCDPSVDEAEMEALAQARNLLLKSRDKRVKPGLDAKIITSWNGLMISGLAVAGHALGEPAFIDMALRAKAFIEQYLTDGNQLYRSWCESRSPVPAYLDDHAALALADIDLFECTGDPQWRDRAVTATDRLLRLFYHHDTNELFMSTDEHETPLLRISDVYDQGSPSGTGLAAQALIRCGKLAGKPEWIETGLRIAGKYRALVQRAASATATLTEAALLEVNGFDALVSEPDITVTVTHQEANRFLLEFGIPAGWHLNPLPDAKDRSNPDFDIRMEGEQSDALITTEIAGTHSWLVTIEQPRGGSGSGNPVGMMIRYQPCSTAACLPVKTVRREIVFG